MVDNVFNLLDGLRLSGHVVHCYRDNLQWAVEISKLGLRVSAHGVYLYTTIRDAKELFDAYLYEECNGK